MLGKWPKSRHVVVQSMGFTPKTVQDFTYRTVQFSEPISENPLDTSNVVPSEFVKFKNINRLRFQTVEVKESAIGRFVEYYNHERYHESLNNLTPADVYYGRGTNILRMGRKIKKRTMNERRRRHRRNKVA